MNGILLISFLLLFSQVNVGSQSATASAEGNCTVSGIVESAATGKPIRDAVIAIERVDQDGGTTNYTGGGTMPRALTDPAGYFAVKNVEPGRYIISASASGYVTIQYGDPILEGALKILRISPGERVKNIRFKLERGAAIVGHVQLDDGQPVERALITAARKTSRMLGNQPYFMPVGSATTDDRGEFRIFDLAPGDYYVSATASGARFSDHLSIPTAYYPGVTDSSKAQPITVGAGQVVSGINLTLERLSTFHIRGRVINAATEAPATRVGLSLISHRRDGFDTTAAGLIKNAQGEFDFPGIPAGSYVLYARLLDHGKFYGSRRDVTVVISDVDGVELHVTAGATLHVILITEDLTDAFDLGVALSPQSPTMCGGRDVTLRAGQNSQLDSLCDGTYVLMIWGQPKSAYVKSATIADRDALDSGVEIDAGRTPDSTLRIVVSGKAGRVEGDAVLKGKPFKGADVTIFRADYTRLTSPWWATDTLTDTQGKFVIEGVRPGKYRVLAWEEGHPFMAYADFLQHYERLSQLVDIGPRAKVSLHLEVVPASEVPGSELF